METKNDNDNETVENGKGKRIVSPHDKFVKIFLGEKETAESLFKNYLPAKISENLDFSTLRISKDTFVDKKMADYYSDILYEICLLNIPILIYLLLEHKSEEDHLSGFQLLTYIVGVWRLHLKQNPNAKTLPVIIPVLIYHGSKKWSIDTNFNSLFNAPDYLKDYIPEFSFHLQDISHIPDEEIKGEVLLRILFKTLKYIFTPELRYKLREIFELFLELKDKKKGTEYLEVLLRYLTRSAKTLTINDLKETVTRVFEKEGGDLMATIADKLKEEGRQEGKQEGWQEGRQEGMEKKAKETAMRMLVDGLPIEKISKYTGLPVREIDKLMAVPH
jgi:predicted transposase/invertase (TIGR01784 family)